ncbi:Tomoregulin-2 [Liparis tanakae]|uniref:Tomoregulin-2 n=1 Tax=Liparis tanakae TaxID=230148 RepID=A0A4Z2INM5_9TELE|nr:Tomoregulin-2 [Liparis tanakae]
MKTRRVSRLDSFYVWQSERDGADAPSEACVRHAGSSFAPTHRRLTGGGCEPPPVSAPPLRGDGGLRISHPPTAPLLSTRNKQQKKRRRKKKAGKIKRCGVGIFHSKKTALVKTRGVLPGRFPLRCIMPGAKRESPAFCRRSNTKTISTNTRRVQPVTSSLSSLPLSVVTYGNPHPQFSCRHCNNDYAPVCGSNNHNYQNECFLHRDACKQQSEVLIVSEGACPAGTCVPHRHGAHSGLHTRTR